MKIVAHRNKRVSLVFDEQESHELLSRIYSSFRPDSQLYFQKIGDKLWSKMNQREKASMNRFRNMLAKHLRKD